MITCLIGYEALQELVLLPKLCVVCTKIVIQQFLRGLRIFTLLCCVAQICSTLPALEDTAKVVLTFANFSLLNLLRCETCSLSEL